MGVFQMVFQFTALANFEDYYRFVMEIYRISTTGCVIVQRAMQNVTESFDIV